MDSTNAFTKLLIQAFQQLSDEQKEQKKQPQVKNEEEEEEEEEEEIPKKQSNLHKSSPEEKQTTSNTSESQEELYSGILKCYNPSKKYGFITYNDKDIFVHESAFINIHPNKIKDIIKHPVTFNIHHYNDKSQNQKQKAINVSFDDTIINNDTNQKQLTDTAKNNNKSQSHQNRETKTFINDAEQENESSDSESNDDSDSDSDNESELESNDSESEISSNENENDEGIDNTLTLEDFVVSLLKFAPKHKLLISELGLKITDTFDKSIKQLTGFKSREFFDGMKEKQIIKIKTKTMENGELAFAQLMNKNIKKEKQNKHKIKKNNIDDSSKKRKDNNVNNKVRNNKSHKNDKYNKKMDNKQLLTENPWISDDNGKEYNGVTSNGARETIRSAILRNFIDGSREKVMLSAINSYCKKYVGIKWKDIMVQTPREFINDMVYDKLVILDKEIKNNTPYPFIVLNQNSEKVMKLDVKNLTEIIDKKGKGVVKRKDNNNNDIEMIENVKGKKGKKRKLDNDDDMKGEEDIKEPKRKKQKNNVNSSNDKIILQGIKLNKNGMEMAQKMIEKFKKLQNKHDVHFHFEFDQ